MENIIEFKNVTFKYDEAPILSSFSLSIKKGKHTVLLGPNGSGKSTIAKLIMGLLECNSGTIYVNNKELNEENIEEIRKDAAIVFQNPDNQFIGTTVEDDIAFGLENRNVNPLLMKDIIESYLHKVNMQNFINAEPQNLSGGQKQRVAIAGALALKPKLLILDEATSMLDPKGKKEINSLIEKIKRESNDLSIISITHHIDEALLADEIVVINKGKIIKCGTPKEILFDENLLKNNSLLPPFVVEVQNKLKESGISLSPSFSLEELAEKLWKLKLRIYHIAMIVKKTMQ